MNLLHSLFGNKAAQRLAQTLLLTTCCLILPFGLTAQDTAVIEDTVSATMVDGEQPSELPIENEVDSITDQSVTLGDKLITFTDEEGQVSVKVFKIDEIQGQTQELKPIYEGTFSDEKSVERYTVAEDLGFTFPLKFHKREKKRISMQPHWAGFGMGLSNIVTPQNKPGTFYGYQLNSDKSFEWTLNLNEFMVPLVGNFLGLTMGVGLDWRNYYMDGNVYMASDGQGINVLTSTITYESARLRSLHITTPLFLEWQPTLGNRKDFFVTAGVVGGYKAFANYKVKYEDRDRTIKDKTAKGREMHMPPLMLDYMVQVGMKDMAVYAKYSPFGMFKSGQGPDVHTVSVGFILQFED
jgi:hypothetical protein